ncbi:MAG TPA: 16S rRNA (cytidine(1402)-2'-O)-methyltransferase [Vicinamibacterales bacterium]|nr:16S rRNA (cytidine(1402)-2'-O)-methyltransferase [Vicinamibacterales bacterium]
MEFSVIANGTISFLPMPGRLYVVSTPIGNLDDITLRALNTLKSVALVAAEDTRRTSILLRHFGIGTPSISLHDHNERQKLPQLLQKLEAGSDIALVSDAGTPLVADPGQRLIAAAIARGIAVVPIPGASAVLAALTVSGLSGDAFVFAGFVPSRSNDRIKWLRSLANEQRPLVFFETPHRIQKTLAELPQILGDRPIVIARELTKLHEEVIRTATTQLAQLNITRRGEFTIVVGPKADSSANAQVIDDSQVYRYFCHLTETGEVGRRPAITRTAQYFGLSTKLVFATLEKFKNVPVP